MSGAPAELVPMKLPRRTLPVLPAPEIEMPADVLKPMTFPAPAAKPPIVLLAEPATTTPTPLPWLPPPLPAPMKLPITTLPVAAAPEIDTPAWLRPMEFAAAAVDPPMVLFAASTITPTLVSSMSSPIRTLAEAAAPEIDTPAITLPWMKFVAPVVVPPIVLPGASRMTPTPSPWFRTPIEFPSTTFAVAPAPEIDTPAVLSLKKLFDAPEAVPPIVLADAESTIRPTTSELMVLPVTTLPVAAAPEIDTPA